MEQQLTPAEQAEVYRNIRRKFFPLKKPVECRPTPEPEQPQASPPPEPTDLSLHRLVREAERIEEMFAHNEPAQRILSRDVFRPSCAEIIATVAHYYGRTMDEMRGPRRGGGLALHRQIAAYLCIRFTLRSLPEIGRQLGGRDHSTIHHANARIRMMRDIDASIRDDLQLLIMRIIERTGFQPER